MRSPNPQIIGFSALCCVALLGLSGCQGKDTVFDKRYNAPVSFPKSERPLTVKKTPISYLYSVQGKRNPFCPPPNIVAKTGKSFCAVVKKRRRAPTPSTTPIQLHRKAKSVLETFSLDQLTVVALIVSVATPIALIEDPNGRGYIVRRGTFIGRHGGQVVKVHRGGLQIRYSIRDVTGRSIPRDVLLPIRRVPGASNGMFIVGKRKVYIDRHGTIRTKQLDTRSIY